MTTRVTSSLLLQLPEDLVVSILSDWLVSLGDISSLDVALCSQRERLSWLYALGNSPACYYLPRGMQRNLSNSYDLLKVFLLWMMRTSVRVQCLQVDFVQLSLAISTLSSVAVRPIRLLCLHLDVSSCYLGMTFSNFEVFSSFLFPNLTSLYLTNSLLGAVSLSDILHHLSAAGVVLHHLTISQSDCLSAALLIEIGVQFPYLRSLSITNTPASDLCSVTLSGYFPELRVLRINVSNLSNQTERLFWLLAACPLLEELYLHGFCKEASDFADWPNHRSTFIARLASLRPKLQVIVAENILGSLEDFCHVASHCPNLRFFCVGNMRYSCRFRAGLERPTERSLAIYHVVSIADIDYMLGRIPFPFHHLWLRGDHSLNEEVVMNIVGAYGLHLHSLRLRLRAKISLPSCKRLFLACPRLSFYNVRYSYDFFLDEAEEEADLPSTDLSYLCYTALCYISFAWITTFLLCCALLRAWL
eukprot:scaffold236_cov164-Ochromonas_danica.AAC.12